MRSTQDTQEVTYTMVEYEKSTSELEHVGIAAQAVAAALAQ